MDAVEFLKEANRMCCALGCSECELNSPGCNIMGLCTNPCDAVKLAEQWSKEHPRKTRLQDFLEKFPKAPISNGLPTRVCPRAVGYMCEQECNRGKKISACWNEPVED